MDIWPFIPIKYVQCTVLCGFVIFVCLSPSLDIPETLVVIVERPCLLYAVCMFYTM